MSYGRNEVGIERTPIDEKRCDGAIMCPPLKRKPDVEWNVGALPRAGAEATCDPLFP